MQNKTHPPLANALLLSSLGIIILSSSFFLSFFYWRAFFSRHSKTLNPNPWLCWAAGRRQKRQRGRVFVWHSSYKACYGKKDKGVKKRQTSGCQLTEEKLMSIRWVCLVICGCPFYRVSTAPCERSYLKTKTQHKMCTQSNLRTTLFLLTEKSWKGGILVNYGSLQSAKITVNCCHLRGALTHYGIFPS